jgi:tetratricopeptide (TPR) repeat protein
MKKLLFALIFFFSFINFAQDNSAIQYKLKEITGVISSESYALPNVNILVESTKRGTNTNADGFYKIRAKAGEILVFSHINMKPIKVLIEDVTTILNLDMQFKENFLNEISITTQSSESRSTGLKKPRKFLSGRSNIDTRKAGFAASFIKGSDLNQAAASIAQALRGKVSNYKIITDISGNEFVRLRETSFTGTVAYALWDVDGVISSNVPNMDLNDIKDIAIVKGLAGTNKYGSEAVGGVIVVNTISNSFASEASKDIYAKDNKYTNKEYYNEDAVSIEYLETGTPSYYKLFEAAETPVLAYEEYKNIYPTYKTRTNFHFDSVNYFINSLNSKKYGLKILSDLENFANSNPEILKAIAYKYQELRMHQEAIDVYKKIMIIRPKHAQSYRDLANGYSHLNQYKNAWKIYLYYLKQGFSIEDNAIGDIFNTEMKAIYVQRKQKDSIREKLVFQNNNVAIANDVRMVIEWDTSEAEFILEFVNPSKQSFKVDHSLAENSEQILDEKIIGYNSKEFLIEKVEKGDWLINLTYLGNKKFAPTFLKVTTYFNWGKPNQKEEIKVHELTLKNVKAQLLTINKNKLYN